MADRIYGSTTDILWYVEDRGDGTIMAQIDDSGDYAYFSWSLRKLDGTIVEGPTDYSTKRFYTFRNVPSGRYRVYCSWSTTSSGQGNSDYVIIGSSGVSIDRWDWSASNGSATANQTVVAYDVISNKGNTAEFSYKVWNDLVDKVVEVYDAIEGSWNTKYLTWKATRMQSDDRILTADRFNSLRYNIGINVSTGIDEVSRGDPVMGWYFERLTNRLNEWIDDVNG